MATAASRAKRWARPARLALLWVTALVAGCGAPPARAPSESASPSGASSPSQPHTPLSTRAAQGALASSLPAATAQAVEAFYRGTSQTPAWIDDSARPTVAAREAVAVIARATRHGLDPADYGATDFSTVVSAADPAEPLSPEAAARFDVRLSAGLLQLLHDIHVGRVDPRTQGLQLVVPPERHDLAIFLRAALDEHRLATIDNELAPRVTEYRLLQQALERYRAIAARAGAAELPNTTDITPPTTGEIEALLTTLGDLTSPLPPAEPERSAAVRAAVEQFQRRHGLTVDAAIGPATSRAMRVPLTTRVRQIELALERLRWLPDTEDRRVIVINIPMFRLFAWERAPREAAPALTMRVIVGRALDTRTPVFAADMAYLAFRPYWNVPATILKSELLPAITADPGYLARERLEIVQGARDSSPVLEPTADAIALLARGQARVRQRPGPTNALGLVKFMFPNSNDVYIHSTPAPALFGRTRRDFSHGCIRVEDPIALAAWVLGPDPAWTREAIVAAFDGANNQRVNIDVPVHVMILYSTAAIDPVDGSVNFADDLYGLDVTLDKAL